MTDGIRGISSMATRQVLGELAETYAGRCAQGVSCESVGGVEAARRVLAGEPFDFVVLAAEAMDPLEAAGRILPDSRIAVAQSEVAVAVAAGSPHPDIGDELAVRRAVLAARSIGYSTGPSGNQLMRLFERWGISAAIAPRLVKAAPGVAVGSLLARGEVELGFQQLSELIHLEGIEVLGSLPATIAAATIFTAALCTASARGKETREFLSFLGSEDAAAAKLRHGMQPAP